MGVVNAKLLSDNVKRISGLSRVGLSNETIASAIRDKTGDPSVTPEDVQGFNKLGALGSKKMLVSANQGKRLTQFAQAADSAAEKVLDSAKEKSKAEETEANR